MNNAVIPASGGVRRANQGRRWQLIGNSSMPDHQAVLYTRQGCHLCEEAHEVLLRHGVRPKLVDIDQDEELRRRFDQCVPVVEIDGTERFRGRVSEVLLRRLLH